MSETMPGATTETEKRGSLTRESGGRAQARRRLVLRDGLVFLVLCLVTVVLFGITLSLFRSFQQHRQDLARRWSDRGMTALREGRPVDAVKALRTALSYQPENGADQLALALALADAGRTEEATNYFLNLWETHPGDGFINLQLARLARREGNAQDAVDHYRAAIFGNWEGDGVLRRRDVRLELAGYLAQRGDVAGAKVELLTAAGNAPQDHALQAVFAERLAALGDYADALPLYRQALERDRQNVTVMEDAGRAAYALGNYSMAYQYLSDAVAHLPKEQTGEHQATTDQPVAGKIEQMRQMKQRVGRIMDLQFSRDLPAAERSNHLFEDLQIARARLAICSAQQGVPGIRSAANGSSLPAQPSPLQILQQRWAAEARLLTRAALARDATAGDAAAELIGDTERQTAESCGTPTGDDALLLMLAGQAQGSAQ